MFVGHTGGHIQNLKLQIEQREKPIALDCERTVRAGNLSSYRTWWVDIADWSGIGTWSAIVMP